MDFWRAVDDIPPLVKLAGVWVGTVLGVVTLHNVVLSLTAVYTSLQIVVFVRDKFLRRGCEIIGEGEDGDGV